MRFSHDDGRQNGQSRMKQNNNIYSDLDLSFIPSPLTGDLIAKTNQEALKRSVRHMFQLNQFDVPFNSSIKCNAKQYLFEGNNQLTIAKLDEELRWIAKKVDPRITITDVDIQIIQTSGGLNITITYKVQSLNLEDTFNFTAERVR